MRRWRQQQPGGYCNPEVDKMIEAQSQEGDPTGRKQMLLEIENQLVVTDACPIIFYNKGATCRESWVKGLTIMENSFATAGL